MFFVVYLPVMGEFHLTKFSLLNIVLATILGLTIKEFINEPLPGSVNTADNPDAHERRSNWRQWQHAIWGFR